MRWTSAGVGGIAAALLAPPVASAGDAAAALARFPAEIRALAPLADGVLVAGVLPGERAFAARLDEELEPRWQRSFDACGRCGFLDATDLGPGRVVLVGYRDPDRSGREDGYLAVLDTATGGIVSERTVLTPSGGRLWAVDAADGLLFAAGEAWTHAGAGLDAWVLALSRPALQPVREWYLGDPLPDASADVLAAGDGVVAGGWLVAGQASAPDPDTGSLALDFRFARLAADGTLSGFGGFDDAATDRTVADLLADDADRHLAVVAARPHPDGPDALELVVIEPERAAACPRLAWRDGDRATVPDVAVRAADGSVLVAGWYRDPPADDPARGWIARFARDVAAGKR